MPSAWKHLIRFVHGDVEKYGDAIIPTGETADGLHALASSGQLFAYEVSGDVFANPTIGSEKLPVHCLLPPLVQGQVDCIRCIGLNYTKHIEEVGRKPPTYPPLFIKPSSSLTGYNDNILVPQLAQKSTDYEGELTIIIGKPARNVKESAALDYVAGYVVSNDVSCREWQVDEAMGPAGGQWCFSKGFDTWAPTGPVVVSPTVLGAADNLMLTTKVNSVVRQTSSTSDLLFGVRALVAFCSQGTTLQPGSLIMTGTPSGVISGSGQPYLCDGDLVEVSIEGLGSIANKLQFVE